MRGCATGQAPLAKDAGVRAPEVRTAEAAVPEVKGPTVRVSGYGPDTSGLAKIKLPDGVNLEVPQASFVNGMYKYLTDATDAKPRAFVFENLNFDGPTAKIAPRRRRSSRT
jgi:hypothetical protein